VSGGESAEVGFEDIAGDDGEVPVISCDTLQAGDQGGIEFHRDDRRTCRQEMLGHLTMTSTNLDPAEIVPGSDRVSLHAVGRDPDSAGNLFAPSRIA
jgi:hypothetical protein